MIFPDERLVKWQIGSCVQRRLVSPDANSANRRARSRAKVGILGGSEGTRRPEPPESQKSVEFGKQAAFPFGGVGRLSVIFWETLA